VSSPAVLALRERLDRLGGRPRTRAKPVYPVPRGFEVIPTRYGDALMRQDVLPLPPLSPHPGNVAYLDTETTGLSGGAGTYVFTAAVARPIDCGLRLAQLFLPQPGMEAAFLAALREEIEPAATLATFNGGSFDLPVLRTRWVMARMDGDLHHPQHVDLLTLVRALFRHRMEQCNLRTVEERLLGYEREDPVSGALAPDAYFDYLQRGHSPLLESVLEHNRLDVISLVHLHSLLMRRLDGADAAMDAADWLALGRHRFRRGARADGWRALRNAAGYASGDAAATAGLWISRRLVRVGSIGGADRLLTQMEERFTEDLRVALARARLLEWRRRDPRGALSVVEAALRRFPEAAAELEPRRARLAGKVLSRGRDGRDRRRRNRRQGDGRQGWFQTSIPDSPA
jgi:uncharacterized protein YprB with RNaseH-like and TPR domain